MYNQNSCTTNYLPTGSDGCESDLTVIYKIFLAKSGFSFATESLAKEETGWDTAIQNQDIIPLPEVFTVENADEESVTETGSTGRVLKVRDGKTINTYNLVEDLDTHTRLRSYDGFTGGYYLVDENSNVLGTSSDGIVFEPFTIDTLNVNKISTSDGATKRKTPIYIVDADITEFNDRGVSFKADWAKGKLGLLPATLVLVSASSTEIVVKAVVSNTGDAISGLETATDWILGDNQTVTTATESLTELGTYTLAGTALVSGTLALGDSSVLSVDGYAGVNTLTITIS